METFYTIRFKRATAARFKSFSKKVGKSYSHTLDQIMDFFEWHGFLPSERFEKSLGQELLRNRKRTEAAIAIIKDIEKNQTKPSTAMLLQLFSQETQEAEEQDYGFGTPEPMNENTELAQYRQAYTESQQRYQQTRQELIHLMDHIRFVKGAFGSSHYKLELTPKQYEELKKRLDHVHHHNTPETGQ